MRTRRRRSRSGCAGCCRCICHSARRTNVDGGSHVWERHDRRAAPLVIEEIAEVLDVDREPRAVPEWIRKILREPHVDLVEPRTAKRVPRRDLTAILVEAGRLEKRVEVGLANAVQDDVA